MRILRKPLLVAFAGAAGLAACGGGGTTGTGGGIGGGGTVGIVQSPDGRILAGSSPIVPNDFVGRTFPLTFLVGQDRTPQSQSARAVGQMEVVDNDTLILTLTTGDVRLVRTGASTFEDPSGTVLEIEDFGAARYLFLDAADTTGRFAYGFETPVAARPVTARFNRISASTVLIDTPGVSNRLVMNAPGTVDLQATFTGSGGTITGTMFDGREFVDIDDDGTNEELFLRTTLNGTINEGGFTGTVGGSAQVERAGSLADANLVLSNTSADGKFFGTAAQVASGTYDVDAVITPQGLPSTTAEISGFFIVDR